MEYYSVIQVNQYLDRIFIYMPFLESDYIHLLSKIQSSKYFEISFLLKYGLEPNISKLSDWIYDYLVIITELESYNNKTVKEVF